MGRFLVGCNCLTEFVLRNFPRILGIDKNF
jgi:hypothetical protein